jgi:hypothetical protein
LAITPPFECPARKSRSRCGRVVSARSAAARSCRKKTSSTPEIIRWFDQVLPLLLCPTY